MEYMTKNGAYSYLKLTWRGNEVLIKSEPLGSEIIDKEPNLILDYIRATTNLYGIVPAREGRGDLQSAERRADYTLMMLIN